MLDLDTLVALICLGGIGLSSTAAMTAVLYTPIGLAVGYVHGTEHCDGLRDGRSGIFFAWDLLSKVDIRDFKLSNEEFLKKYPIFKQYLLPETVTT